MEWNGGLPPSKIQASKLGGIVNSKDKMDLYWKVQTALDFYRGIILDLAEQEWGHASNWNSIRSRLLKAFGDRGLEGQIRNSFDQFPSEAANAPK